jgi:hypothetical protein
VSGLPYVTLEVILKIIRAVATIVSINTSPSNNC